MAIKEKPTEEHCPPFKMLQKIMHEPQAFKKRKSYISTLYHKRVRKSILEPKW
jgi:hypothetical protein